MNEIEVLKRKYEREKKVRETLEKIIEDRNREIFIANKTIEEEKHRIEMYLEVAGVIFVIIDLNQKVTLINKKGCDVLGYKKEEIIGKNWFDNFVPDGYKDKVKEVFDKLIAGDIELVEYFENPVLNKCGEDRIIAWHNSVLKDETGRINAVLSSGEDITEQKKINEALHESEEKFRLLFENAGDGIAIADTETKKFIAANNEFCNMMEYSLEELLTLGVGDIHPKEYVLKVIKEFDKQVRGEITLAKDIPVLRKDGTVFYADINSKPFIFKGKNYLIGIFRDISERKTLEEERMRRSNLETMQSIIVTINHEMNQPLSVVISLSNSLLKKFQEDSEIYKDAKIINTEAWRLANLVKKTSRLKAVKTTDYSPGTKMVDLNDKNCENQIVG